MDSFSLQVQTVGPAPGGATQTTIMEYANINDLTEVVPYNENSDAMFWKGMGSVLDIPAGTLYIAFPEDGHKPCCHQIRQNHYKKMVIKIKIEKD